MTFQNSSILGQVADALFSRDDTMTGSTNLVILYSNAHASQVEPNGALFNKMIQFGHLELPQSGNDALTLLFPNQSSFPHPVSFIASAVRSVAFSIPNVSEWSVPVLYGSFAGFLCPSPNADQPFIPMPATWNVFPTAYFIHRSTSIFSPSAIYPPSTVLISVLLPLSQTWWKSELFSLSFSLFSILLLPSIPRPSEVNRESPIGLQSSNFNFSVCPLSYDFLPSSALVGSLSPLLSSAILESPFPLSEIHGESTIELNSVFFSLSSSQMSNPFSISCAKAWLPSIFLKYSHVFTPTPVFAPDSQAATLSLVLSADLPTTEALSSTGDSSLAGLVAGIAAGLVALILAVAAAIVFVRRFRSKARSSSYSAASGQQIEFVNDTLADSTMDTVFHDVVTYEGAPSDLPSRQFEFRQWDGDSALGSAI
jgi:hypothetical protein